MVEDFVESKTFDFFDMKDAFWQLPLAEDSQEVMSFMTDEGIFTFLKELSNPLCTSRRR